MATVELRNVWKKYGKVEAVRDLSLTCRDGEFLCLLGPSGCGKSSTMRMIAGLEQVTSGDVFMDGRRVNDVPTRDRDIAMVFENYALYPHMSVKENIATPLRTRRLPEEEIERRIRNVAQILSIEDLLPRRIQNLSGGQKQRVGIGRAIVREPRLFIMDEPISHLEARLRAEMRTELKRLHARLGITTLYVTHDQLEAVALADRIAVMNLGELQQIGAPAELFDHPVNEFVAGFIGSPPMNFLPIRSVTVEGPDLVLRNEGTSMRIASGAARLGLGAVAKMYRLGIRPVDVRLRPVTDEVSARGRVVIRERLGERDRLLVELSGETVVVDTAPDAPGEVDGQIGLVFPVERVHLFDGDTGRNILAGRG